MAAGRGRKRDAREVEGGKEAGEVEAVAAGAGEAAGGGDVGLGRV